MRTFKDLENSTTLLRRFAGVVAVFKVAVNTAVHFTLSEDRVNFYQPDQVFPHRCRAPYIAHSSAFRISDWISLSEAPTVILTITVSFLMLGGVKSTMCFVAVSTVRDIHSSNQWEI